MSVASLYLVAGAAVAGVGLAGLLGAPALFRRILALNLLGTGVFVILVAAGRRADTADPVPQAMVLTGLVVSVAATAFALALLGRIEERRGRGRLPEDPEP